MTALHLLRKSQQAKSVKSGKTWVVDTTTHFFDMGQF